MPLLLTLIPQRVHTHTHPLFDSGGEHIFSLCAVKWLPIFPECVRRIPFLSLSLRQRPSGTTRWHRLPKRFSLTQKTRHDETLLFLLLSEGITSASEVCKIISGPVGGKSYTILRFIRLRGFRVWLVFGAGAGGLGVSTTVMSRCR